MALSGIDLLQFHLVGDGLKPGLEWQDVVIAGDHGNGLELEPLGEVHRAD